MCYLHAELSDYEWATIKRISCFDLVSSESCDALNQYPSHVYSDRLVSYGAESNVLFRAYPALKNSISYFKMGQFPAPVVDCFGMTALFPKVRLFVKHDGMSASHDALGHPAFGGNKMRKLQYLIADAMAHGHTSVLTFGYVGSNHATLTAACARDCGLACYCLHLPQINARVVRRNIALQDVYGAKMILAQGLSERAEAATACCLERLATDGTVPYVIPTGGSVPLGAVGYVEAAFELKEQIEAGEVPMPEHIYVACGSYGTAAGLIVGCKLARIGAKIHPVLVEPADPEAARKRLQGLIQETNELLHSHDAAVPLYPIDAYEYELITSAGGDAYGAFTPEGVAAIDLMRHATGIELDGVYSGKCCSAMLDDMRTGALDGAIVLFWNTFCAESMEHLLGNYDYRSLPQPYHRWFEEDVQPLDA